MTRKIFMACAALVLLSGCASTSNEIDASATKVDVLTSLPAGAKVIGPVEASHCKRNAYESASAEQTALQLLRGKAAGMGANAVANVSYEAESVSLLSNCWSSAKAKATAVRR